MGPGGVNIPAFALAASMAGWYIAGLCNDDEALVCICIGGPSMGPLLGIQVLGAYELWTGDIDGATK